MIWDDTGFLLSKNRYNENSLISEIYTKKHGKVSGIIFGATSNKIKNFLFIGNHFNLQLNSKNQNKIGYFKIEIEKIFTPHYLEDKVKLNCKEKNGPLIMIFTYMNRTLIVFKYIVLLY